MTHKQNQFCSLFKQEAENNMSAAGVAAMQKYDAVVIQRRRSHMSF